MGKYSALQHHLASLNVDTVRLTFREIETVLGDTLPPSARKHAAWWGNADRGKNGWPNLWKRAGWARGDYSISGEWVTFFRHRHFDPESIEAREGYEVDRSILTSARNAALAAKRKQIDNYTCQVCGFRFETRGQFVIDVHHLDPLGKSHEVITTLDKLVSLCPCCHRIAHLRSPPYDQNEIRELLKVRAAPHSVDQ